MNAKPRWQKSLVAAERRDRMYAYTVARNEYSSKRGGKGAHNRSSFVSRKFVRGASLTAFLAMADTATRAQEQSGHLKPQPPLKKKYRAAAIGSTGRGDFGHGLDAALVQLPGVEFVAIADDNPAGLKEAGKRCGVAQLYTDYRRMLDTEQIDLVTIGMRHADRHEEVVVHCAEAGKHIYCEKPVAIDLASFDRMVEACDKQGVKLSVALPNRVSPAIQQALRMVREGRLGKLLSLRAQGKCDRRGGGEDLMVLGYHNLDLMCFFAGQPQWAFAQVLQGNSDATKDDAQPATEPIGPVAGDCVAAMFGFADQVHGYFDSHRDLQGVQRPVQSGNPRLGGHYRRAQPDRRRVFRRASFQSCQAASLATNSNCRVGCACPTNTTGATSSWCSTCWPRSSRIGSPLQASITPAGCRK